MSKQRYVVESRDERSYCRSILVDSFDGREVFSDGGEPEDQSLFRDLSVMVDELNTLAASLEKHANRASHLEMAIRKHRNARGHDRCWENDLELYAALGDGLSTSPELPTREEFLSRCKEYYEQQRVGMVAKVPSKTPANK